MSAQCPEARVPDGIEVRALTSFETQPWRNGGGTTRPLAYDQDGAWRISLATVVRDGPYSRFAGMTRLSLVMQGAGVTLRHGDVQCRLSSGAVADYDGDVAWDATLHDGPVLALNAMAARGVCRASIRPLTETMTVPSGCFVVALTIEAECTFAVKGFEATLDAAHVLLRDERGPPLHLAPHRGSQAALVLIEFIDPRS